MLFKICSCKYYFKYAVYALKSKNAFYALKYVFYALEYAFYGLEYTIILKMFFLACFMFFHPYEKKKNVYFQINMN